MTEQDDTPAADEAEKPLSEDEMDGIAGGVGTYKCRYCGYGLNNDSDLQLHDAKH